jgi:hypothetical protein
LFEKFKASSLLWENVLLTPNETTENKKAAPDRKTITKIKDIKFF